MQCNAVKKSKVFVHFCRFQFKAFFLFLFLEKLMRKNPPTTCALLEGREKRLFKVQIWWEGHKIFPLCFEITYIVQSNLVIRNFLVTLKLFLNAKCSLSLWSKLTIGHGKWFLITNLCLITKFDCNIWNKFFVTFLEYLNFRPSKEKEKKQFLAKLHWKRRVVVVQ